MCSGFPLFQHCKKNKFLSISLLVSVKVTFMSKKKSFYEFPQKCFKTVDRHCLAVCGSHYGEKQFLLIFIHFYRLSLAVCGALFEKKKNLLIFFQFYWFDQKQWFKQIQIFLRICPFSNMVRKTYFSNISVLVPTIVTFMSKKKSSLWVCPKMLQNNRKA